MKFTQDTIGNTPGAEGSIRILNRGIVAALVKHVTGRRATEVSPTPAEFSEL